MLSPRMHVCRQNGYYWTTYFAQPTRDAIEPPPGATGLARSVDGVSWERATSTAMMDTFPARGAQPWEYTQIYAPYLLVHNGTVYDFYNANSGHTEQSGLATLPLAEFPGVDGTRSPVSRWLRNPANPIVRNGPTCVHQVRLQYNAHRDGRVVFRLLSRPVQ